MTNLQAKGILNLAQKELITHYDAHQAEEFYPSKSGGAVSSVFGYISLFDSLSIILFLIL